MRWPACAFALLLAPIARPAAAQAYQCRLPGAVPAAPPITRDGPIRRAPIAGYTLSLSWSPAYCRTRTRSAADRFQCGGQIGRFGLVLHGLWPQARAGVPAPQWCADRPPPSPATVRRHLCTVPSARLIAREWAKHGTCIGAGAGAVAGIEARTEMRGGGGITADAYWTRATRLYAGLRLPDLDRLSRRPALVAGDLRRALADANRALPPAAIGLVVRRGWLQEIRLCYDAALRPAACGRGRFGPPDAAPLKIWRGL